MQPLKSSVALFALAVAGCVTPLAGPPQATVSVGDVQVTEGGVAVVPITKTGGGKAKFTFETSPGSASEDVDYSGLDGTISTGSSMSLGIGTVQDTLVEGSEAFSVRIFAASGATSVADGDGTVTIADDDVAPPQPITCWDGSVVIPPAQCPPEPPKPPSGDIPSNGLTGLAPINSVDPMLASKPAAVPPSGKPDVLGAFRLTCGFAGLGRFDPKVYPGDTTGKSHGHQFYGNTSVVPSSSYETLRAAGPSTCSYGQYPGNRSAYWQPWLEDGRGNVLMPDYVTLYYKRRPSTDPLCNGLPGSAQGVQGKCVDMPHGMFYIFGFDFLTNTPPTGQFDFTCQAPNNGPLYVFKNLAEAAASGKCVAGGLFSSRGNGPPCWDGKFVDTVNHRSHVAYGSYGGWGYYRCPDTHPYVIPQVSLLSTWRIVSGDDLRLWRFSSDKQRPELPAGTTIHVDFFMAWEPGIKDMWEDNCIEKLLNCSGGVLGNGRQLNAAYQPFYPPPGGGPPVSSWTNPYRVVPEPGPESYTKLVGMPAASTFAGKAKRKGDGVPPPLNRATDRFERIGAGDIEVGAPLPPPPPGTPHHGERGR